MNVTPETQAKVVYEPGRIEFRCQTPADHGKLEKVCPVDQTRLFEGRWDGLRFVLVEVERPEMRTGDGATGRRGDEGDASALSPARPLADSPVRSSAGDLPKLTAMSDADLQVEAAQRGVKWDKKASRETMLDRIAAAATGGGE